MIVIAIYIQKPVPVLPGHFFIIQCFEYNINYCTTAPYLFTSTLRYIGYSPITSINHTL